MIKINLLPVREKVKRENLKRQAAIGGGVLIAFLGVLVFLTYAQQTELSTLRERKTQAEQRLAALKKEVGDLEAVKKKKEAMEKRKNAIADLNRNRHGLVKALDELTRDKPREMYFVTLEQKTKASPWEDFTLAISGVATDNEVVAQFMRNLQSYKKTFPSVDLEFTKAKVLQKEAAPYQEFQLVVQVAQEKPPAAPKPGEAKPQEKGQPKAK